MAPQTSMVGQDRIMTWNKGMPKVPGSGRAKGVPNKAQAGLLEKIQAHVRNKFGIEEYDPLKALAEIANDPDNDVTIRAGAHKEVVKYIHPQKKAVEVTGAEGGPLEVKLELADRLIAALEKAAK